MIGIPVYLLRPNEDDVKDKSGPAIGTRGIAIDLKNVNAPLALLVKWDDFTRGHNGDIGDYDDKSYWWVEPDNVAPEILTPEELFQ